MNAREELYAYATVAFQDGVPPVVHDHLTKMLDAYRAEVLREAADALEARVADEDVDTRTTWAGMDAAYLRHLAASSGPAAGDKQPETEALCRCGHLACTSARRCADGSINGCTCKGGA